MQDRLLQYLRALGFILVFVGNFSFSVLVVLFYVDGGRTNWVSYDDASEVNAENYILFMLYGFLGVGIMCAQVHFAKCAESGTFCNMRCAKRVLWVCVYKTNFD